MKIETISPRSIAYIFDELNPIQTCVYHIEGPVHQFLIDTYCGTDYLEEVLKKINSIDKPLIVINTHSHWDHIWGNCAFAGHSIISHSYCRKDCNETWEDELEKNKQYAKGNCTKTLPNITFEKSLEFAEDGILLFHTPGHSRDSISIFDEVHRVMYAGDNIELPLVYLNHANLDMYEVSLRQTLTFRALRYTASHTLSFTEQDIIQLISYITKLKRQEQQTFDDPYANSIHQQNLQLLEKYQHNGRYFRAEEET